jgi:hypothetical protein
MVAVNEDFEQELEWLRQLSLIYSGIIAILPEPNGSIDL